MKITGGLLFIVFAFLVVSYAWLHKTAYSFEFSDIDQATVSFSTCNHLAFPKCSSVPPGQYPIQPKTLELLETVKFCGSGDTTPDASITIHADSDVSFGLVRMEKMGIQNGDVGLAFPCYGTQGEFDQFIDELFGSADAMLAFGVV